MSFTFDARDIWATQVPYFEPDKINEVTKTRTLVHATQTRSYVNLLADATTSPLWTLFKAHNLNLRSYVRADAEVVTP
jgi:hypothetical protein